jgi:hypothetical protein
VRTTQHRDNANFVKLKLSWIVCLWKVARIRLGRKGMGFAITDAV